MPTSFDRWEKDPFFSAAEEVQESADRMESVYRQWIQETTPHSKSTDLFQELRTALGTAKWQLEELDRAVESNDEVFSVGESTVSRHRQFIAAIGNRITMVENSLKESNLNDGETNLTWVRLDEGERDELALFLSGPCRTEENVSNLESSNSNDSSANPDVESWKVSVSSSCENSSRKSSEEQVNVAPPAVLAFSGLANSESASKVKWYRNGFRKWRGGRENDTGESLPLRSQQNCLDSCGDEVYDKQINGWIGALQRQLQRSQYRIQYGRPIQMIIWVVLAVLLIVIFALRSR